MKQILNVYIGIIFLGIFNLDLLGQEDSDPFPRKVMFSAGKQGLAMSGGYYRNAPVEDLSSWTASLWFRANSEEAGALMEVVLDAQDDEKIRFGIFNGLLRVAGPVYGDRGNAWQVESRIDKPLEWHMMTLVYDPLQGVTLYIDGLASARAVNGNFDYTTPFKNFHFGVSARIQEGSRSFASYFDGLIDDFTLFSRGLRVEEVELLFKGEKVESLVAFNDFENANHRALARPNIDEAYLEKGRAIYEFNCATCHSKDGIQAPINPLARAFTKNAMLNGGDPYSMFRTLTYGYNNMMPSLQLSPTERYNVIHYLREKIIKKHAPQLYVNVSKDYTAIMPKSPGGSDEEERQIEALTKSGYLRDYGRAFYTRLARPLETPEVDPKTGKPGPPWTIVSGNALVIDLGENTAIAYELGKMKSLGAWENGFLDFTDTLHDKLRGSGSPLARFDDIVGSEAWRWAWDGQAENKIPDMEPLTVYPEDQYRYHGHYVHGGDIVLSYSVQGRGVLESPMVKSRSEEKVIHHRLLIEPGKNSLELVVGAIVGASATVDGIRAQLEIGAYRYTAWVLGDASGLRWRISESNELVLRIPATEEDLIFDVAVVGSKGALAMEPENMAVDLSKRKYGSAARWTDVNIMEGRLDTSEFQGYAFDSLPVPFKNAYNSWMRTASLAFFPDGSLAVSTLGGDVWMVSGIDDELEEVTWKRYAAGLNEPMGMKVVNGILTVTTRGRIIKLHDLNDDGEVDFYESFFNEREPSEGWHAYSFDLEKDSDGYLYYNRVGYYSDWSIPGGTVKVSPDGDSSEVIGVGYRVPNGLGILPDGRVTFSDNQGHYVPAGKISIVSNGSFHGSGKWFKHADKYDPKSIVEPIVYLPQELDSSCGSQLWVEDERFGPLSRQYFHTSFGQGTTMYVMLDELDDVVQGAVFPIPLRMESGTMRLAMNPADGQVYYSGLTGWQAGGTSEGSIQRLRYTGKEGIYLLHAKARKGRLELEFNRALDPDSLNSLNSWKASMWNYQWSSKYGSPRYKVTQSEEEGVDELLLAAAFLEHGGRKLIIEAPDLQPCHTLKLEFNVTSQDAVPLAGSVYFTIHKLIE